MLFPFYNVSMLWFESVIVINRRLAKIGRGGTQSVDEIRLMVAEKADASVEAMTALMRGGTTGAMIDRFREHVAENELRLSVP